MVKAFPGSTHRLPDKSRVSRSFGNAAYGYDRFADLQRRVGDDLLRSLPDLGRGQATVVDIGCGTGYCTGHVAAKMPSSAVVALDISTEMLAVARGRCVAGDIQFICGDAESLPLATASADLVISNLAFQWCPAPDRVFRELRRVLKPGGRLFFSTFGPDTLCELRRAWEAVDRYSHVNQFVPRDVLASNMAAAGFRGASFTAVRRVAVYPDVMSLMRELKGIGAHNVTAGRPRHLLGKGVMQRMLAAYETAGANGAIPATFEIIYASGEKAKS